MSARPELLDDTLSSTRSALRTLGLERAGIAALEAALAGPATGLAGNFDAAVALISGASGRVIVTGMGKSGHVGRTIAATMAATGTPAFFSASRQVDNVEVQISSGSCSTQPEAGKCCGNSACANAATERSARNTIARDDVVP